ncbi:MAG: TolC family protein [Gammaproteobacteria bacterium]
MKRLQFFAIAVSIFSLASGSAVLAADNSSISLADAVRLTLENYPQFRSFELRAEALAGEKQTAALKPPLRVSAQAENIIGTGDLNWFQGTEFTVALSQVIELGEKRQARTEVISQRHAMVQAEQRILELDLLSRVTTRYLELAAAQQRQVLLQQATQLASDLLAAVSERVAAGRSPQADEARAQAALSTARLAEQSVAYEIEAARRHLSGLWRELDPDFDSVTADILQIEALAPVSQLLERLQQNPVIQIYASESRLREAELREAQSRRQGDIEVGAGIRHLAELNDTAFMVQASMPLFSRKRAGGAITAAQANLLRVESEQETARLNLAVQIVALDQQRQLAVNEFDSLRDAIIPELENALIQTRIAFSGGRYSYLELSGAQQELLQAEIRRLDAATRAHLLRAEIERLSGEAYQALRFDSDANNGGNPE